MSNHKKDLVSIVSPAFNYGKYIKEMIESVLKQTYQSLELIIVNDGSLDNTKDVVARYLKDKRIKLINQKNQGTCKALIRGFGEAEGEYLMRLDADDVLDRKYLENTVRVLKNNPKAGFAYTRIKPFGEKTFVFKWSRPYSLVELLFYNYINTSALMRRVAYFDSGGISSDVDEIFEDWDLWLSFAEKGWKGVFAKEQQFLYRQHGTSRNIVSEEKSMEQIRVMRKRHKKLYLKYLPVYAIRSAWPYIKKGKFITIAKKVKGKIKKGVWW